MAEQQSINVSLAKPQGRAYSDCNINERVAAMAPELEEFNRYMRNLPPEKGGGALAPLEMTLIRTYLAWKLSNVTQTTDHTKD
ncbi:hypothetical protein UFOVP276_148 [uncultured Caudovirales phage]|uniref:Uncharacterized protein n=1 Tax=uncultured Caudovirales phage TaxID=2100421 RepID=A0A6J5LNG8_9CAUD|nr:hypothetical protein UFOVP127_42 [uncultured Caudovirales phage]CAB4135192.1 hypothetical protein UFOVP276_148 [uncultured Caudovirales phage]